MPVINLPLNDEKYTPHNLIKRAVVSMNDYRLPEGQVGMASPETGVVVAVILYILYNEPKAVRTKLECYIILLDRMVKEATGEGLFTLELNSKGRISNFKRIFDFMLKKGLLSPSGTARFFMTELAVEIIKRLGIVLGKLVPYVEKLLVNYDYLTAGEMLTEISKPLLLRFDNK